MTQVKWILVAAFLVFSGAALAEILIINGPNGPVYCIFQQGVLTCL